MKLSGLEAAAPIGSGGGPCRNRFSAMTSKGRSHDESKAALMMKAIAVETDRVARSTSSHRFWIGECCFAMATRAVQVSGGVQYGCFSLSPCHCLRPDDSYEQQSTLASDPSIIDCNLVYIEEMKSPRDSFTAPSTLHRALLIIGVVLYRAWGAASIVVPSTNCYVFDNSSHIYDFVSYNLRHFLLGLRCTTCIVMFTFQIVLLNELRSRISQDSDLVIRFCKDVESRSQVGYVDFGRFDMFNYFVAGSAPFNFLQEFYNGDLTNCEQSYDKMGRTAQVNIACGDCLNGQCKVGFAHAATCHKLPLLPSAFVISPMLPAAENLLAYVVLRNISGGHACICNVTYESTCRRLFLTFEYRVLVELAIPCQKQGLRVFQGFTVGFHPRSSELVYNGMTQPGFEKAYKEFSFKTEQTLVALHMTAIASLSTLVRKPIIKISPEQGLEVRLSGSGATGSSPTTLSPTLLIVDWKCEIVRDTPYEVEVTIPVESYEPIQFTLAKMCEYRQNEGGNATRGWAIFGVLSCIFIVVSTLFCCGGFVYKTRVENLRGLDALPGMTLLSACLETVTGAGHSYTRPEDLNGHFVNQASWERQPASTQVTWRNNETTYGSI
ncbi:hypothetical protein RJ639_044614 [Escallonia herrerae]|uniref:Uncharacterized protein n=1 Tax=Escallonia herrerae TaxID=1293975 RepID=A0AA89B2A2_9ASTE|nr:hypothetical protein RJ639_044614 [Escallonia herrerae]